MERKHASQMLAQTFQASFASRVPIGNTSRVLIEFPRWRVQSLAEETQGRWRGHLEWDCVGSFGRSTKTTQSILKGSVQAYGMSKRDSASKVVEEGQATQFPKRGL